VRPGVFAAGDVRVGASNRVASAVGDGALVVRFAHELLSDDAPANVGAPS
jgi:thioredoxin reductase (NADPH)